MKHRTLVFLLRDDQICLAMKKRGFGVGYYNGYGGKQEDGEIIEQCAIRELAEESGVIASEDNLDLRALATFTFSDKPEWDMYCHIYFLRQWQGEPIETEEMRPYWYPVAEAPWHEMWPGDDLWVPKLWGEYFEFHLRMDTQHSIELFEITS